MKISSNADAVVYWCGESSFKTPTTKFSKNVIKNQDTEKISSANSPCYLFNFVLAGSWPSHLSVYAFHRQHEANIKAPR